MSTSKDGGAAFPSAIASVDNNGRPLHLNEVETGMTLRDHFASKALPALIQKHANTLYDTIAENAYYMADAMLRARDAR